MSWYCRRAAVMLIASLCAASPSKAETPAEWIRLGQRVHGGFGALIPLGIRTGLDALQRH